MPIVKCDQTIFKHELLMQGKSKPAEIFKEEYGDLINEIEMSKHYLHEEWKSLCSSYEYGKITW